MTSSVTSSDVIRAIGQVVGDVARPVPLHEPYFGGKENAYVKSCIDDGWVSSVGEFVNRFERDPQARLACIEARGTNCCICSFSFGAVYGPEAEGYIHVHHLRPLSELGGEYVVDPVEDLQPVCPNCHAVLHLHGRCRDIEEVRQLLTKQRRAEPDATSDRSGM